MAIRVNVLQAETFSDELKGPDRLFVIEISADSSNLVNRLVGRLMCPGCGDIYNIYSRVPLSDRICDRCGSGLVRRMDDREDLIQERFRTYHGETYPLVQFYMSKGVYHQVDGMRPIGEITKDILAIVEGEEALTPAPKGGTQSFA